MTTGSGCPPPLLLSRSILQHACNVCQARAGLSHPHIERPATKRTSTPFAPRGMRTIQDPPWVNHLPVGTSLRIAPGYNASRPPDLRVGRSQPASRPPRRGHTSVMRTTSLNHRRARGGRREGRVTDQYSEASRWTLKHRSMAPKHKTRALISSTLSPHNSARSAVETACRSQCGTAEVAEKAELRTHTPRPYGEA
jgi:hypothetical protein